MNSNKFSDILSFSISTVFWGCDICSGLNEHISFFLVSSQFTPSLIVLHGPFNTRLVSIGVLYIYHMWLLWNNKPINIKYNIIKYNWHKISVFKFTISHVKLQNCYGNVGTKFVNTMDNWNPTKCCETLNSVICHPIILKGNQVVYLWN